MHAWECDAMTWNVVEKLANKSHVKCLYNIIGQLEVLSFYGTGNSTYLGHRGLSGTKKGRCRSIRAILPNVL